MSRARGWSLFKTLVISFFSGLGHVLSSVILGFIGIGLGIAVSQLEFAESVRGGLAAWLLIGFGLAYFIWGVHRAIKKRPHHMVLLFYGDSFCIRKGPQIGFPAGTEINVPAPEPS
jgi:nickel/cobalt transporter (NicO) family protein